VHDAHRLSLRLPFELQILPRQNEKDPSRVDVEVMVREKPTQTADVEAEWGIAPGDTLLPTAYPWSD
jgi:hypothetical protein